MSASGAVTSGSGRHAPSWSGAPSTTHDFAPPNACRAAATSFWSMRRAYSGVAGPSTSLVSPAPMVRTANPAIRLLDGAWYADDPHRHFRWMREHAPVYRDEPSNI